MTVELHDNNSRQNMMSITIIITIPNIYLITVFLNQQFIQNTIKTVDFRRINLYIIADKLW